MGSLWVRKVGLPPLFGTWPFGQLGGGKPTFLTEHSTAGALRVLESGSQSKHKR